MHIQTEFVFEFIITLLKEWQTSCLVTDWYKPSSMTTSVIRPKYQNSFERGFRLSFYFLSWCQACI